MIRKEITANKNRDSKATINFYKSLSTRNSEAYKKDILVQGSLLEDPYKVPLEVVGDITWMNGCAGNDQLGFSLYASIPYSWAEGFRLRDPYNPKRTWVRVVEPITNREHEEVYDMLIARSGNKPEIDPDSLPDSADRIRDYIGFYRDLTREQVIKLLLIEGYDYLTILQGLGWLIAMDEISLKDTVSCYTEPWILPADMDNITIPGC